MTDVARPGSDQRAAMFRTEVHIPSEGTMEEVWTLAFQMNFVASYCFYQYRIKRAKVKYLPESQH
jgi:hypothetical protein